MRQRQSVNIRQISQNRAEQVGYYRFLDNEKVTVSELERSVADHCQQQVAGLHVLAISDSSEINLQAHVGRLKGLGLGVVGNNRDIGFFIHPTLVLNADNGFPLGLSAIHLWSRECDHADKHQRDYQNLSIEAKEVNPPPGQQPIHWRLLTTHEVVCLEQAPRLPSPTSSSNASLN